MRLSSQAVPLMALGLFPDLGPGIIELFMYLKMYIVIWWGLQKCLSRLSLTHRKAEMLESGSGTWWKFFFKTRTCWGFTFQWIHQTLCGTALILPWQGSKETPPHNVPLCRKLNSPCSDSLGIKLLQTPQSCVLAEDTWVLKKQQLISATLQSIYQSANGPHFKAGEAIIYKGWRDYLLPE